MTGKRKLLEEMELQNKNLRRRKRSAK